MTFDESRQASEHSVFITIPACQDESLATEIKFDLMLETEESESNTIRCCVLPVYRFQ